MQNHFSEIHVLVHALHGDVLDHATMHQTCDFLQDVFAEQVRTGICIAKGTAWSIDTATPSLAELTKQSSLGPVAAPLPSSLGDLAKDALDTLPDKSQSPAPTADAPFADVLATDSPLSALFEDAFSPESTSDLIDMAPIECIPPFSLFNVRETLKQLGYGPQLIILDQLAPLITDSAISSISVVCGMPQSARAPALCASSVPCDPQACSPHSTAGKSTGSNDAASSLEEMLGKGEVKGPQCLIDGIDPCEILKELNPTAGEIEKILAIPETPLDSQGCDNLDFDGLDATIEAFWVLRSWSQRSPSIAGASRIVDALLSADFASEPEFLKESSVTRIVFGVPRLHGAAETDLGAYAANAAIKYKSSTVDFVWRQ